MLLFFSFAVVGASVVKVEDFGAIGDGRTLNTLAFSAAFRESKRLGGGKVVVGAGRYLCGPIVFTSDDQELVLERGATIVAAWDAYGTMNRANFATTWPTGPKFPEGPRDEWKDQYAPFVYAAGLARVGVSGGGTIDGAGDRWWRLKDKDAPAKFPKAMVNQRPFTVRFDFVRAGRVSNIKILDTPFWGVVPFSCSDLVVEDVEMRSPFGSPNTDGVEPMNSTNVVIRRVFVQNGDDSITIKSGCAHVLVENCTFQDGHGANVGSVQGESIENVTFRNIRLNNTMIGGGRIKARHWQHRKVVVKDVRFEDFKCLEGVDDCARAEVAVIDMQYGGGPVSDDGGCTVLEAVWKDIVVSGPRRGGTFNCSKRYPCQNIALVNVSAAAPNRNTAEPFVCAHASGSSTATSIDASCLSKVDPIEDENNLSAIPREWRDKASRAGLIWAWGDDWRGLAWRDDASTTSRGPQFGNGYTGSVAGGPEFIAPLFCDHMNRAAIPPTDAFEVSGLAVVATAMDMETGVVQRLWCDAANNDTPLCGERSAMQSTYASESSPRAVVSSFVLANHGGATWKAAVDGPPKMPQSTTYPPQGGKGAKPCLRWETDDLELRDETYSLSRGTNGDGSTEMALLVLKHTKRHVSVAPNAVATLFSVAARATSRDARNLSDTVSRVAATLLEKGPERALALHAEAFRTRRLEGVGIYVEGGDDAILVNSSLYALANSAPHPAFATPFSNAASSRKHCPFVYFRTNGFPGFRSFGWGLSGVVSNGYNGRTFWDLETWCLPTISLFWPHAAERLLAFRYDTMDLGLACGETLGYAGLDYPWGYSFGATAADFHKANKCEGHSEIHLGGDISLAFEEYFTLSGDLDWLRANWPVLQGIAEFYVDRATENRDGSYSYLNAAGPDESGATAERRCDSVYVSVVAKQSIERALRLASLANDTSLPTKDWRAVSDRIRVLFDDTRRYHPEFAGYQPGDHIKQADVVMIHYPHQYEMEESVLRNDLEAYPFGFLQMTALPLIVGNRDAGNEALAEELFRNLSSLSTEGPFMQWMEKTNISKETGERDPTTGAPNYLTSPGGYLQSIWAGFAGLRLVNNGTLQFHNPRPLPGTSALELRGIAFRCHRLTARVTDEILQLTATKDAETDCPDLFATRGATDERLSGNPVRFSTSEPGTVVVGAREEARAQ